MIRLALLSLTILAIHLIGSPYDGETCSDKCPRTPTPTVTPTATGTVTINKGGSGGLDN